MKKTLARTAFSLAAFCLLLAACGGPPATTGTAEQKVVKGLGDTQNVYVDLQQPIIMILQQEVLPPKAFNPSASHFYTTQFRIEQAGVAGGDSIAIYVQSPAGFPNTHVYQVELVGRSNGVTLDPVVGDVADPGDMITVAWFGYASPPYAELVNDGASGKHAAYDRKANYAPAHAMTEYTAPNVQYLLDTSWTPPLVKRNCWGDMPGANGPNNVCTQKILTYAVTGDFVNHVVNFDPTISFPPTGLIPSLCNLAFSTWTDPANGAPWSVITSYGGQ